MKNKKKTNITNEEERYFYNRTKNTAMCWNCGNLAKCMNYDISKTFCEEYAPPLYRTDVIKIYHTSERTLNRNFNKIMTKFKMFLNENGIDIFRKGGIYFWRNISEKQKAQALENPKLSKKRGGTRQNTGEN